MSADTSNWRQALWLALLVGASVAFSLGFACATPLAAFAAASALTLERRQALLLTGAVWLANQLAGYGFLGYPWTADSFAWGAEIGVAALLACLAAGRVARGTPLAASLAAFAAAFAAYEVVLFALAVTALGATENFGPAIVGRILAINAVAFVALLVLSRLAQRVGLAFPMPARTGLAGRPA